MTLGMSFLRVGYSGSASDWLVFACVRASAASTRDSCIFSAIASWFPGGGIEESRDEVWEVFSGSMLTFSSAMLRYVGCESREEEEG